MKNLLFRFIFVIAFSSHAASALKAADAAESLWQYRTELDRFRKEFGGLRTLPNVPFFQFGMGLRTKYLFKDGFLRNATNGAIVKQWEATETLIVPSEYTVQFKAGGGVVRIVEDEQGAWIEENGTRTALAETMSPLRLPRFEEYRHPRIMRVLHHELLINVIDGKPVPNFFVYGRAWYRDGAMMALCFDKTGNVDVIRKWILGLTEVFDRNNNGEREADNPGQVLYLLSLASDKNHRLVPKILTALKQLEATNEHGVFIKGRSDFAEHPVYQTKWAKFGLRALGLSDPYIIPAVKDSYSSLFWMDFRDAHVKGAESDDRGLYPYLGWATDHFKGEKKSPISNRDYPLTWEIKASQANYSGMERVDRIFVTEKTSVPHTWHAAEIFLYLLERKNAK